MCYARKKRERLSDGKANALPVTTPVCGVYSTVRGGEGQVNIQKVMNILSKIQLLNIDKFEDDW